ncbi:MAG: hypothetical protein D4R46_02230 [Chloroflexi bacterium]|nr:MAG: hypothetical protein D4R46_02230 [Chloroflexota bacterium]
MKFRLTILVFLLSLALAACSLAEDITPPAGYSSPTSVPTIVPATQTPEPPSAATPTPTSESVATAAESTPAATDSTTPSAEVSPTAQADVVVIDGTVTLASGAAIPDGTTATLRMYTTSGQEMQKLTTPILPDGKYEFINVPADNTIIYLVTVDYKDVTYESSYVQFDGTLFQFDMPITVYDSTSDMNVLTITQAHLQFDFSTAGQVQIMALYVISNPGGKSVVVSSDGTSVPFIQIPEGATNVQYQLAQSSSPLINATNGFALLPGADKQYGIISTFTLPYTNRLVFTQPFSLPVSSVAIIMPEGVKVRSDQLTDAGTQSSTGSTDTTYHLYQGSSLASGSTLTLTISGMPGDAAGFVLDQRTWLMIGVGALGLILIGLGVFLFLRDRKLRKLEEEFEGADEEGDEDALGDDRENIMDAIIALDDQYKAGDISKEAYEKRRDELKDRLKNLA